MPDPTLRFEELWEHHGGSIIDIDQYDLLILRHHALLEVALEDLLSVRLMCAPPELGELTFARLARLALAGMGKQLQQAVLQLNTLRNYAAHDVSASELEVKILAFLKSNPAFQAPWPDDPSKRLLIFKAVLLVLSNAVSTIASEISDFRRSEREKHKSDPQWVDERGILEFVDKMLPVILRVDEPLKRRNAL
jgi:hypothetical protein